MELNTSVDSFIYDENLPVRSMNRNKNANEKIFSHIKPKFTTTPRKALAAIDSNIEIHKKEHKTVQFNTSNNVYYDIATPTSINDVTPISEDANARKKSAGHTPHIKGPVTVLELSSPDNNILNYDYSLSPTANSPCNEPVVTSKSDGNEHNTMRPIENQLFQSPRTNIPSVNNTSTEYNLDMLASCWSPETQIKQAKSATNKEKSTTQSTEQLAIPSSDNSFLRTNGPSSQFDIGVSTSKPCVGTRRIRPTQPSPPALLVTQKTVAPIQLKSVSDRISPLITCIQPILTTGDSPVLKPSLPSSKPIDPAPASTVPADDKGPVNSPYTSIREVEIASAEYDTDSDNDSVKGLDEYLDEIKAKQTTGGGRGGLNHHFDFTSCLTDTEPELQTAPTKSPHTPSEYIRIPPLPYSIHLKRATVTTPFLEKFGRATRITPTDGPDALDLSDDSYVYHTYEDAREEQGGQHGQDYYEGDESHNEASSTLNDDSIFPSLEPYNRGGRNAYHTQNNIKSQVEIRNMMDESGLMTLGTTLTLCDQDDEYTSDFAYPTKVGQTPVARPGQAKLQLVGINLLSAHGTDNMKEIDFTVKVGGATETSLTLSNQRERTLRFRAHTVLVRFEPSPTTTHSTATASNTDDSLVANPFTVASELITLYTNEEYQLKLTFAPGLLMPGVYSGVLKIQSARKVIFTILSYFYNMYMY